MIQCEIERENLIVDLQETCAQRFNEIESQANVLSKIEWLDHTCWPKLKLCTISDAEKVQQLKKLKSFGVSDIKLLYEHFSTPFANANISDVIEVVKEFNLLKQSCQRDKYWEMSSNDFWPHIYQAEKEKYKNILLLVELLLCVPFSTAVVERGFSSLRRMTDWRSHLNEASIRSLMHFSVRKPCLAEKSYRERLIKNTASRFIDGKDVEGESSGGTGLSLRRINGVLKRFRDTDEEPPLVKHMRLEEEDISSDEG